MDGIFVIGGNAGLPPGLKDLLEREFGESCQCELEKDIENAHKQNLEFLRKNDILEKENKDIIKRLFEIKACGGITMKSLEESESRYKAALEAGKCKDEEIESLINEVKRLNKCVIDGGNYAASARHDIGCLHEKVESSNNTRSLLKAKITDLEVENERLKELTDKQKVYEKVLLESNSKLSDENIEIEGRNNKYLLTLKEKDAEIARLNKQLDASSYTFSFKDGEICASRDMTQKITSKKEEV